MDKAFQGEHLLPGHIGQIFVILSFGAALLSTISYYFATTNTNKLDKSWLWMGRLGFYANTVAILGESSKTPSRILLSTLSPKWETETNFS